MFMKKTNYIFISLVFISSSLVLQSCKDEKNAAEAISEVPKEIAVEILQEKQRVQFTDKITAIDNSEFLDGEYIQQIRPMFAKQFAKQTEEYDTISIAEQIPVITCENITQEIYSDGTFAYESVDVTPQDLKFIENLNVNPRPEEERVVKTVVKDNFAYLYNSSGGLIRKESVGDISFKPMLDSLANYVETNPQGVKANVSKVKSNIAINKALSSGMRLISQTDNEVVMEMTIENSKSTLPQKAKSTVVKKALMRFSPDMAQMHSQKIYEGSQLVQSVEIEYANDQPQYANAASGVMKQMLPTANMKSIKYKSLSFKPDGSPYITNNIEEYSKNQVTFNFKKK